MAKNKSFLKLLVGFTCILSYFNLYGTIVNAYFGSIYGLTDDQTSILAGTANVLAIVSCIVISLILDKFKKYKAAFLCLNAAGIIIHAAMTILIEYFEESSFPILMVMWTICSMCILPIYTCCMDFVCEMTYPVGESISGGTIMMCTQIAAIGFVK
jgi:Na+/melibiose symporter-like transporter